MSLVRLRVRLDGDALGAGVVARERDELEWSGLIRAAFMRVAGLTSAQATDFHLRHRPTRRP